MQPITTFCLGVLASLMVNTAQAQLSGNVGVVSLYKSRGIDQDGRDQQLRPALQGGVGYAWDSGWYVNNWNSTGRFGDAHLEIDLALGFTRTVDSDLSYDVGYVHYLYPGEGSWNSGDLYAGVNYKNLSFYIYRGMRAQVNKKDSYYLLTYKHPLTPRFSLTAGLGFLDYGASGLRSKTDAAFGIAYELQEKMTLTVQLQSANHRREAFHGERDTRLVVGISTDF